MGLGGRVGFWSGGLGRDGFKGGGKEVREGRGVE